VGGPLDQFISESGMVAIVSGNSLGVSLGSLETLGQRGVLGQADSGRNGERVYVNAATGNLVLQDQDDRLVARGLDSVALRTYNSQGSFTDDNGDNWSNGIYAAQLKLIQGTLEGSDSKLLRTAMDGAQATYEFDAAKGHYVSAEGGGAHDTIAFDAATGQLVWTEGSSRITETYQAGGKGRLLARTDASGNNWQFKYDGKSGTLKEVVSGKESMAFVYEGALLKSVVTTTSTDGIKKASTETRRVYYDYDTAGRLAKVTVDLSPEDNDPNNADVYTTEYGYDGASKRVAWVTQTDGSRLDITYIQLAAGDWRVESVTNALGHRTDYAYDTVNRRTAVKDAMGNTTVHAYDDQGRLQQIVEAAAGSASRTTAFEYDTATGDLLRVIDGEGRAVRMEYDERGSQLLQEDAEGNTVRRTYSDANQLLTETVYAQANEPLVTRYVYDEGVANRLRFVVGAEGRVTEHRYDEYGLRQATLEYTAGRFTTQLSADQAPGLGEMTAWVAMQDPSRAIRRDIGRDFRGQLLTLTQWAHLNPDGSGAQLDKSVTQYRYSAFGLLQESTDGEGRRTSYSYDGLGRLEQAIDALLQVTHTVHDDAGARTVVTHQASGRTTTSVYDRAGRLVSLHQGDTTSPQAQTTRYFHDASNRLRMTQDATGVRQWFFYDEAGRKVADIDADGSLTEYVRDDGDLLVQTLVYATRVDTAMLVDGDGLPAELALEELRPAASAGDRRNWNIYDAAGRLVKVVDAMGAVTESTYDGASRIVQVRRYEALIDVAGLPAQLRIADAAPPANDALDRITRHFYDAQGLGVGTLDAEGYLTEQVYDEAGRLVQRKAYATATTQALRASGTLAELRPGADAEKAAVDAVTTLLYNGRGLLVGEVDAEAYLTEQVYDKAGNLVQRIRYANRVTAATTPSSTVDGIRSPADREDRATGWSYDALNRMTSEVTAEGTVTEYRYDAAGNLESTVRAAGSDEARSYLKRFDVLGRVSAELSPEGAAQLAAGAGDVESIWRDYGTRHTYDAAGRLASSTDAQGKRTVFFHDLDGRVRYTVNAAGEVTENGYDAFGQQVFVTRYGTAVDAETLASLTGGLDATALVAALRTDVAKDSVQAYSYDARGALSASVDAVLTRTAYGYNAFGEESSRTAAAGTERQYLTTTAYDRRGLRKLSIADAGGIEAGTKTEYDAFGRIVLTEDPNGNLRRRSLDRLGRAVATRDATLADRFTEYDAFSRTVTQWDALLKPTSFTYNRLQRSLTVVSPEGVQVVTVYNAHGQTQSVTEGPNTTHFEYDANGQLKKTLRADQQPLVNTYDRAGLVKSTTDAQGTVTEFSYDGANRVLTRTVDPGGLQLVTKYTYEDAGQRVHVTEGERVTTFSYDLAGRLESQMVDPEGLKLETRYGYDELGRTVSVTGAGKVTRYEYDKLGRREKETVDFGDQPDHLNLERSYTYDDAGNVRTATDPGLNVTKYTYDNENRLRTTIDAAGVVTENVYDKQGRQTATKTYKTRVNPAQLASLPKPEDVQQLLGVPSPLAASVTHVHDEDGRIAATVNELGEVVKFGYDAAGNVILRIAYANRVANWQPDSEPQPVADPARDQQTRTVYDALNRAIYTVDGTGALVAQKYDGNGNVTERIAYARTIDPATPATRDALDAAALAIADPAHDQFTINFYDRANRLEWTGNGVGAVTRLYYDEAGRVVQRVQFATPHARADRDVAQSSADRVSCYTYDGAGRLRFAVDALGTVTENFHDAAGNLVQQTVYAERVAPAVNGVHYTQAALEAATAGDPRDRIERFAYDAAGRRVLAIDATGAVTETGYDGIGRVTATRRYANRLDASGLGQAASEQQLRDRLTADDSLDRITRHAYDDTANRTFVADPLGHVTQTQYDTLGRVAKTIQHATPLALGSDPASVQADPQDRMTTYGWDAAGRLTSSVDALNGRELSTYDGAGNRLSFTNKKGAVWSYDYDAAGRMTAEISPEVGLAAVRADADGNLVADAANWRASASVTTRLAYDALGNLVARTEAAGRPEQRTTRYEYDALGRQVKTFQPVVGVYEPAWDALASAGTQPRSEAQAQLATVTHYDVFGDAVAGRDSAGHYSYKSYDKAGRLLWEVDALGQVTGYQRDTFGDALVLTRYSQPVAVAALTQRSVGRLAIAQGQATLQDLPGASLAAGYVYWTPAGPGKVTTLRARALGATVWSEIAIEHGNGLAGAAIPTGLADGSYELEHEHRLAAGVAADTIAAALRPDASTDRSIQTRYDGAGRATGVTEPQTDTYDATIGRPYTGAAKQTRTTYNAFGEATRIEVQQDPTAWNASHTFYDRLGRAVATVDALDYLTTQRFDAFGNLEQRIEYADPVELPADGRIPAGQDSPANRITRYSYDALNRKLSETHSTQASRTELAQRADGVLTLYAPPAPQPPDYVLEPRSADAVRIQGLAFLESADGSAILQWDTPPLGAATPTLRWRAAGQQVWENASLLVQTEGARQYFFLGADVPAGRYEWQLSLDGSTFYGQESGTVTVHAAAGADPVLLPLPATANVGGIAGVSLGTIAGRQVVQWQNPGADITATLRFQLPGGGAWWDAPIELTEDGSTQYAAIPDGVAPGDYTLQLDFTRFATVDTATTRYFHDALGNVVRTQDALAGDTYSYYDALGRVTAVVTPRVNDEHGALPLTQFYRDAHGNVLQTAARAGGAADASADAYVATESAADRIERASFDPFGHQTQATDAMGVSRYFSYDARGNVAKSWQAVEDGAGLATMYQVNVYDALGQLTRVLQPAAADIEGVTRGTSATETTFNAFGEMTGRQVDGAQAEYWLYDQAGRVWKTNEGDGVDRITLHDVLGRATADIRSAGSGGADTDIRGIADVKEVINTFRTHAGLRATINLYDKLGRVIRQELPQRLQAQGGVATAHVMANGEILQRATRAAFGSFEFNWEPANRVKLSWSSLAELGSGDIKVELRYLTSSYAVAEQQLTNPDSGQVHTVIPGYSVSGQPTTLTRVFTAEEAASGATLQWTDAPNSSQGGIDKLLQATVYKKNLYGQWVQVVDQAATHLNPQPPSYVTGFDSGVPTRDAFGPGITWSGPNHVDLRWASLAALGSGDVKVEMEYLTRSDYLPPVIGYEGENQTPYDQFPALTFVPAPRTLTRVYTAAEADDGIQLTWDNGSSEAEGISAVTHVVVHKQNAQGQWVHLADPQPQPHAGNVLTFAAPQDPSTQIRFDYRPAGTAGDGGWIATAAQHFGNQLRLDMNGVPHGSYEYRVRCTPQGQEEQVTATGTVTLTPPELAAIAAPVLHGQWAPGTLGWQSPSADVVQTFRYRPLGSSGVWGTLQVHDLGSGYHGVDTTVLVSNDYEYELLYTQAGQILPYAHTTGRFEAKAAQGLPHIPGANVLGTDDGNVRIEWPYVPGYTASVHYKVKGSDQWLPLASQPDGDKQFARIGEGLAPGEYDVRVLGLDANGTAVAQATALVTLKPPAYPPVIAQDTTPAYVPAHTAPAQNLPYVEGIFFDPHADGSWSFSWNAPADPAATVHFRMRIQNGGEADWFFRDDRIVTAGTRQSLSAAPLEVPPGNWELEVYFEAGGVRTHQVTGLMTSYEGQDVPTTLQVTTPPYQAPVNIPGQGYPPITTTFIPGSDGSFTWQWTTPAAGTLVVVNYRQQGAQTWLNANHMLQTSGTTQKVVVPAGTLTAGVWETEVYFVTLGVRSAQATGVVTITPPTRPPATIVNTTPAYVPEHYDPGYGYPRVPGTVQRAYGSGTALYWDAPPAGSVANFHFRPSGGTWITLDALIQTSGSQQFLVIPNDLAMGDYDLEVTYGLNGHITNMSTGRLELRATSQVIYDTTPPYQPPTYYPAQNLPVITASFTSSATGWSLEWPTPAAGSSTVVNYRLLGASTWINANSLIQQVGTSQRVTMAADALRTGTYEVEVYYVQGGVRTAQVMGRITIQPSILGRDTFMGHSSTDGIYLRDHISDSGHMWTDGWWVALDNGVVGNEFDRYSTLKGVTIPKGDEAFVEATFWQPGGNIPWIIDVGAVPATRWSLWSWSPDPSRRASVIFDGTGLTRLGSVTGSTPTYAYRAENVLATFPGAVSPLPQTNTLRIDRSGITLNGVHYGSIGLDGAAGMLPFFRITGGGWWSPAKPKLLSLTVGGGAVTTPTLQLTTPPYVAPVNTPARNLPEIALSLSDDADSIAWQAPPPGTTTTFRFKAPGAADFVDASAEVVTEGSTQRIQLPIDAAVGNWQFEVKYLLDGLAVAQGTGTLTVNPDAIPVPTLVNTTPIYVPPTALPQQNHPMIEGIGLIAQQDGGWILSWPEPEAGQSVHLGVREHDPQDQLPFNYTTLAGRIEPTGDGRQRIVAQPGELPPGSWDFDLYFSEGGQRTRQASGIISAGAATTTTPQFALNTPPYIPARYGVANNDPFSPEQASHGLPQRFHMLVDGSIPGSSVTTNADGTLRFAWTQPTDPVVAEFSYKPQGSTSWTALPATTVGPQELVDIPLDTAAGQYDLKLELRSGDTIVALTSGIGTVPAGVQDEALPSARASRVSQQEAQDGATLQLQATSLRALDRWGNVLRQNDPRRLDWTTDYAYDARNQLISQIQLGGGITRYRYDALGRQIAVTDANGHTNQQKWDAAGNLIAEVRADGGEVQHRYNALGQRTSTTNELGHTSDFAYDKLGRLSATTTAAVAVHHVNAGDEGWPLISDGQQRLTETITWDRAGRKLSQVNGAGEAIAYQYDLRGNVIETVQAGVTSRMAYDAQGRKIAERDGNGRTATWDYDYFGQLKGHQDIGGADYDYTYDHARQLTAESNDRPNLAKNVKYHYDAAGQLTHIQDITHGKWSVYSYDLAGHRVREQTLQAGITYQDNHLAYDELGRLQWVADGRAHLQIDYDKVGNRTLIRTHVINGDAAQDSQRHFHYDAMNRQIVADAVNAAGELGTQGHRITYDKAGNKVSDTWHGNVVRRIEGSTWSGEDWEGNRFSHTSAARYEAQLGMTTEVYGHDAMDRITSITRDGTVVDERTYDKAGRIVQTGAVGLNPDYVKKLHGTNSQDVALQGNGTEVRSSIYDATGRLYGQRVHDSEGHLKYQLWYAKRDDASQLDVDGAGNMLGYLLDNKQAGQLFHYRYAYEAQEGYREATITGEHVGQGIKGITTQTHDANGFLIEVGDSQQPAKHRHFVNDAAGKVLYANQGGHVQRQLIVNGEVLGRYGEAVDPNEPASAQGVPVFTTVADFSFGFDANTAGNTPMLADTTHTVGAGDTLQSIAQLRYGDSRLWYRIAEANGVTGNEQLTAGQVLKVPGTEVSGNASGTFKPYNAGEIVGDTSPYIPQPKPKKPSFLAQLLVVIVMVVVTILTAGAAAAALGSSFAALSAATAVTVGGVALSATGAALAVGIGAAVGSIVSQAVAVATGVQEKFSWKQVGMSAIGGAVSGGMGNWAALGGEATGFGNTVIRAAVGNMASQGIGVATGLQDKFNWRAVAASAVGAGVGHAVGESLGLPANGARPGGMQWGEFIAKTTVKGMAAGLTTAAARGGRIAVQQVAVDAFGNALGESLASASTEQRSSYSLVDGQPASGRGLKAPAGVWDNVGAGTTYGSEGNFSVDYSVGSARLGGPTSEPAWNYNMMEAWRTNRDGQVEALGRWAIPVTQAMGAPAYVDPETGIETREVSVYAGRAQAKDLTPLPPLPTQRKVDALDLAAQGAQDYYRDAQDRAEGAAGYVGAKVGGLAAEVFYDAMRTGRGMYQLATDADARARAAGQLKYLASNPEVIVDGAIQAAVDFAHKPFDEQANSVFKGGLGLLAGAGVGKIGLTAGELSLQGLGRTARWLAPAADRMAFDAMARLGLVLKAVPDGPSGAPVFESGKYARRTDVNYRLASDVNAAFPDGWSPPYRPGTRVTEFTTTVDDLYVRVHGDNNKARSWMMKREAIEGLTDREIQSKYALPELPTFMSEVHVPAGTRVRAGIVNPVFHGIGNAIQYELLQRLPGSAFRNTVRLGQ